MRSELLVEAVEQFLDVLDGFLLEVLCLFESRENFVLLFNKRLGLVVFLVNFENFIFDLSLFVLANRGRFLEYDVLLLLF